ncbi:MAG: LruC domain-containing protein [Calditrichia bacterium]
MVGKLILRFSITFLTTALLLLVACGEHVADPVTGGNGSDNLEAPDDFDFSTTQNIELSINTLAPDNSPLTGIRIDIYSAAPDAQGNLGAILFTGATNSSGLLESTISIAKTYDSLYVEAQSVGFVNQVTLVIESGSLTHTFGGQQPLKASFTGPVVTPNSSSKSREYVFIGEWDNNGVPNYLTEDRDVVDSNFLRDINASLPERKPVPTYHPEYIAEGTESNIVTTDSVELWITFVHEGAGYKNGVGYYTYDVGNPPENVSDISELIAVFPNFSYKGGGGGLYSGDKIYMGKFPPNKEIGWFIVANGWNKNARTLKDGNAIYFSDPDLNPESDPAKRPHNVLLYDEFREILLIGFEDLNRNGGDNDFNDAVFYVTASEIENIKVDELPPVDTPDDCDNDGIDNTQDDYPCDANKAFNVPATAGTIGFEDEWPSYGDFDYNDLVIGHHFTMVTNSDNLIKAMFADFVIRAMGTDNRNGFGFQLPISSDAIATVTGSSLTSGYINIDAKGLESNQTLPTIIVFDDGYDLLTPFAAGDLVNTQAATRPVDYDTVTINIEFGSVQTYADIGDPPFNSFIIIDGERGKELHAKGAAPTDLVDDSYFGTEDDKSNANSGKYYYMQNNLSWSFDVPGVWDYPYEGIDVDLTYYYWTPWINSSGTAHTDWYTDASGNRDEDNIYYPFGIGKR